MPAESIKLYGASWCPDTSRARRILETNRAHFTWYDVDIDSAARSFVESVNRGKCRIPTIVFIDGTLLVEPNDDVLEHKLATFS
jgi:glutaredoxin